MTTPLRPEAAAFIREARVARLATLSAEGGLHVVPICPVLDGEHVLFATEPTRKVRNIRANANVGLAFDHYDEDWSKLAGVSVSGKATLHEDGEVWDSCRDLLYEKFPQYERDAEIVPGRTLVVLVEVDWVSRGGL